MKLFFMAKGSPSRWGAFCFLLAKKNQAPTNLENGEDALPQPSLADQT
jgi:hypothetical protein